MVTINLLPWREKAARYEKQQLQIMLVATVVFVLLTLVCGDRYLNYQQQFIAEQISQLKKEREWRTGLLKVNSAQQSFTSQTDALDFFRRLNEVHTADVCFEKIKKTRDGIEFSGLTNSAEQLTRFLQTASIAAYFPEIKITQLQQYNGQQVKFRLLGKLNAV